MLVSLGQPTCTANGNHSTHGVSDGTATGATVVVVLVVVCGSVVGGIVVVTGFRVTVGLGWVGAETGAPFAAVAQAVSTAAHSTAAILTRLPCRGWCDCCCSWLVPLFDWMGDA